MCVYKSKTDYFYLGCLITMPFSSDMTKLVSTRQQLDAQLNENKVVQEVKPA